MIGAGLGNLAGGYANSSIYGESYGWGNAGSDFASGAASELGGRLGGKLAGYLFKKAKANQWISNNIVGPLAKKLRGQYKCPAVEAPTSPSKTGRGVDRGDGRDVEGKCTGGKGYGAEGEAKGLQKYANQRV